MIRKLPPAGLKNIGPVSLGWLREAGIRSRADLIRLGAVQAYLRIKTHQSRASLNLLWALAGAERGLRWNRLPDDARERLLLELDAAQGASANGIKSFSRTSAAAQGVQNPVSRKDAKSAK